MHNDLEADPFDHKKIYSDLIDSCKKAKLFDVKCIVDEAWTGFKETVPFTIFIYDGIFICKVISTSLDEAKSKVAEELPVLRFLDEY